MNDLLNRAPRRLWDGLEVLSATEYLVSERLRQEMDDGMVTRGMITVGGSGGDGHRVE